MTSPPPAERRRVVIVGGGVAGLEAMLALHALAPERFDVTLVASEDEYAYEPLSVGKPFGLAEVRRYPLNRLASEHGATFLQARATAIDPDRRVLETEPAGGIPWDALLVALGAERVEALHGVLTFYGERSTPGVVQLLEHLRAGRVRRVAFVVPRGVVWPFPLYELALMTGEFVLEHGIEAELTLVTPAPAPLALFGTDARETMAAMLDQRAIAVRGGYGASLPSPHRLMLEPDGGALEVDEVVSLPQLVGPRLPGLPHDRDGFIPTDEHGRVTGLEGVFAAGDSTTFPIKQGGLAAQQADAAVPAIMAEVLPDLEPEPFRPVMRGVLLTGGDRRYLRAEMKGADIAGSPVTSHTLWWPPAKVAGRYLAPALGSLDTEQEIAALAPEDGVPVEIKLPHDLHTSSEPELLEFGAGGHGE
jgi:sulfide:quinone oxidoreductase